jgi:hypothetical protein
VPPIDIAVGESLFCNAIFKRCFITLIDVVTCSNSRKDKVNFVTIPLSSILAFLINRWLQPLFVFIAEFSYLF